MGNWKVQNFLTGKHKILYFLGVINKMYLNTNTSIVWRYHEKYTANHIGKEKFTLVGNKKILPINLHK